ncbi:hypothetical protein F511_13823 [Dorcoceras hygrometricum]|uniref:Uncharacterized protein n=1 Tax=Dorcoceras hygrometricum TaxID=472368 RepID=A0A2Z7D9K1_9LAMI|nr:hypothetical protein F511_13823 [Dorcoceras hygrometricum]
MMNQLKRCQPAASAKERSEPAVAIQEEEESRAGAMKKSAGSVDDISSDIIIQQEATVISRKIQQMRRDALDMIQQEDFALIISAVEATVDPVATQRFPDAVFWSNQTQEDKSIVVEEDSGEAIDKPDASNSSIQSRAYLNQLLLYIQSRDTVSSCKKSRRKEKKKSVALKWKEDKIVIWSAEQFWKLSNGKKFYRGYIFEATPIEEVLESSSSGGQEISWSMMNQLKRCQPAASAKERSEPAVAIQEEEESRAGAMKKSAGSVDDISSDVIIQQEATVISRKIQQMRRDALDMIQQEDFALIISAVEATVDPVATQRFPDAVFWSNQTQEDKSIVVEEDSGEAIDKPDASNSSIQSRAYLNQLLLYIQSRDTVSSRKKSRRKEKKK